MVTHNMEIASATDRVVRLVKGRVEGTGERGPLLLGAAGPMPAAGDLG
jgi:hypothetical protein